MHISNQAEHNITVCSNLHTQDTTEPCPIFLTWTTSLLTHSHHEAESFMRDWPVAASQEIPRIYGTPRFITAFTSARHLSLS
jgi:hypothetical protein